MTQQQRYEIAFQLGTDRRVFRYVVRGFFGPHGAGCGSPGCWINLRRAESGVFRDMQSILRGLHVTRTEADASGTRMVAQDLVVRNFGGRFGRTELRFDAQGRLVREMAHI